MGILLKRNMPHFDILEDEAKDRIWEKVRATKTPKIKQNNQFEVVNDEDETKKPSMRNKLS